MPRFYFTFNFLLAGCCSLIYLAAENLSPIQIKNVTAETGIKFTHSDGSSGRRYIVETVASGVATFDFDGDGKIDILFLNGTPLPGLSTNKLQSNCALYKNLGGFKFEDVTRASGLTNCGYNLGVCIGDYDNDGHLDIYLNNYGSNRLYKNNGNGTFSDVTQPSGVGVGDHVGAGACFLDMDGDGDLDLFVGNYINFSLNKHQTRLVNGFPAYVGPATYGPIPSFLFRNNGNGTFTDVSSTSGIASHPGMAMGVVCADYDQDGDTDIVVGNDSMENFVWENDGRGNFKQVSLLSGLAYDSNGVGQGTMGVDCADYDNDGRLDFHMTSYQKQWALLYHNDGMGLFSDVTARTGGGLGTYNQVEWGNGFVDFNNDGFRDIFIACGHLQDNIAQWDDTGIYAARSIILANNGRGKFTDISASAGDGLGVLSSSRGAAFDDLDNDGDVDVVINNSRAGPTLLRNDSAPKNHWLGIRLKGTHGNRNGVGASVRIISGDLSLIDEVHSGRGYQSHFGFYPHFGLGQRAQVDRIEVRWIGGKTQLIKNPLIDRIVEIVEPSR